MQEPCLQNLPKMAGQTLFQILNSQQISDVPSSLMSELEELRGEKIEFVDIYNIPCVETSDALVRNVEPLVSVNMLTFNHERYIKQAIEGIVNQKTNFPFELVIGEDCSSDKTREIVFEYQKKYPHIIRVLTSEKNLFTNGSSNGKRTLLATRGKYIALCEGDDYWTDMDKLQKEADYLESHPEAGLVGTNFRMLYEDRGEITDPYYGNQALQPYSSPEEIMICTNPLGNWGIMTLTVMYRRDCYLKSFNDDRFQLVKLTSGDSKLWYEAPKRNMGVGRLNDVTAVYRIHRSGFTTSRKDMVSIDGKVVRYYFYKTSKIVPEKLKKLYCLLFSTIIIDRRFNIGVKNRDRDFILRSISAGAKFKVFSRQFGWLLKLLVKWHLFAPFYRAFSSLFVKVARRMIGTKIKRHVNKYEIPKS